ncbi:MAG: ABC transporter ATP-binding protein, partial [Microthrixaceae bacterium]|nr:ABC transporter ATP-binding protein [Microthrixaceae bacterium]
DGVGFSFGDARVLHDVSFRAEPGEVLAIVGSTGSGKSTLVNLLAHLDEPTSGTIRLGGVETTALDADELRAAVSVAYQESYLFARSIVDNVRLGRDVSDEAVQAALRRSLADGFVSELPEGPATVVGERGVTLSGGQRQRIALARALAGGPRVVVAD